MAYHTAEDLGITIKEEDVFYLEAWVKVLESILNEDTAD